MTVGLPQKLIEVALPLPEINDASAYDKMPGIGPHPKGIHHWWARLPLPTARAVLFASVVDDPSAHPEKWPDAAAQDAERERLFDIIRKMMTKKLHEHREIYDVARTEMLRHCGGKLPILVDPFAGGGSIPLEGNRLGFETHASDLNPVAVLLNRCNLELAPRWVNRSPINPIQRGRIVGDVAWRGTDGLSEDIRYYSKVIGERAARAIGRYYPRAQMPAQYGGGEADAVAWLWVWTVASPNPAASGRHVPLASSYLLGSNGDTTVWVDPIRDDHAEDGWRFEIRRGKLAKAELQRARLGSKAGKGQDFICLLTNTPIARAYVQSEGKAGRLKRRLMAIVVEGRSRKNYLPPDLAHEVICAELRSNERVIEARATLLSGALPTRAEITGGVCTAYGLSTWGHLFSERQILALLTVSDLIAGMCSEIERDALDAGLPSDEGQRYAQTVITFLALANDRCADFNNSLCRWSASNQKVMNLFGKQALPMVFDCAEANFIGHAVGSWSTCSEYVADCVRVITAGTAKRGSVRQVDAAADQNTVADIIVSTDPPYYNNISYAVLSDFFYVWLRRSLGRLFPDIFGTMLVPKKPELIAAANRFEGDQVRAKEHFEQGFRNAFRALRKKMDPSFPLTVYYAFKQDDQETGGGEDGSADMPTNGDAVDRTTGWETMLEALIGTGFQITGTWPVRASQKWRMVSMGSNALASYIVLVCRPRPSDAPRTDRRTFLAELKRELPPALKHLQEGNIAPVDLAQAALGPGMAIYSRYTAVLEATGQPMTVRGALKEINRVLDETLAEQEGDLDADTRFCVAWFEQHGTSERDYGEAEVLFTAKNTSFDRLERAGLIVGGKGKIRLKGRDELNTLWNPQSDTRITDWECVQQLVRAMTAKAGGGVPEAARLINAMGPARAENSRALAYRLHTASERKSWTDDALAYNILVTSWQQIHAEAEKVARGHPVQSQLSL